MKPTETTADEMSALFPISAGKSAIFTQSRNSPCNCGSGLRTKDCCGKLSVTQASVVPLFAAKQDGLRAQRRGEFAAAIAAYEHALAIDPQDFDAAHMRAVALYQLGCMNEACAVFFDIIANGHALTESAWHNFGLAVAASVQWADDPALVVLRNKYRESEAARLSAPNTSAGSNQHSVSVVLASYNHAPFVEDAIRSVLAQTKRAGQLIVIDDGSTDDSAKRIEAILRDASIPCELIVRENKGASHTLNEGIERATGEWILPLNSDDRFGRDRLEALAPLMKSAAVDWGYGRVHCIDAQGHANAYERDTRAYALRAVGNASFLVPTTGLSFLLANPAISTGNLFFRKALWTKVGGFRDWRYHHDWHFALSASKFAEPVFAPQATYDYRIHEKNTIAENREKVQAECRYMMKAALAELCDFSPSASENCFAPCPVIWKRGFFATVGGVGFLELLPAHSLHSFATMFADGYTR